MRKRLHWAPICLAAALAGAPGSARTVDDATGDIYPHFAALPAFAGGVPGGFDVLRFGVTHDGASFLVQATFAGRPDQIGEGFHVFGVDRGGSVAPFGANLPGVLFNSAVIYDPVGPGGAPDLRVISLTGGAPVVLDGGSVIVKGNRLSFSVPFSALPSTGLSFERYGWNLWPRVAPLAFQTASDFAPDNATIDAVPEPATWGMMILGFGVVGAAVRARRKPEMALA